MLCIADQWGDDRDDLRAAMNTVATMPAGVDHSKAMEALVGYLEINRVEHTAGPAQMRAALES